MKVLLINAVSGIKSTGRICVDIANYVNENGHEAFIAHSTGPSYPKGFRIGNSLDRKLHALCSRIFGLQAYFSKNSTNKLVSYIKTIKPDIVHLGNLHSNFINLKILSEYLATNNIPTVITLHDCWFFTGKCTHYTVDHCYKWQAECNNCPRLKKDNKSWFFDRTKRMHNDKKNWLNKIPRLAVVGVSKWIAGEARKSILKSASIITHIYNWIDLEVFKPLETSDLRKKMGLENKFIVIGVASGWSNKKGLNKFLELSKLLPDDMTVILVGSMKKTKNLPNNLIHIEETHDTQELAKFYSMADVLISFSMEETFGMVAAEALSCGTPVILMDSTGSPELLGEGCGYISKKGNTKEVLSFLKTIKENGKSFYSQKCRNFAQSNFKLQNRISDYLKLYKTITR